MDDQTQQLGLPYILPAQAQKHVSYNECVTILDATVQLSVQSRTQTEPPVTAVEGDRHIVAVGAIGAWQGRDGQVAIHRGTAWAFLAPKLGWQAYIEQEDVRVTFANGSWGVPSLDLDGLDGVGINTTSDAVNRLAVSSAATLLTHSGSGHQLKINKAQATDTGSLLFQTNWSGRAELGTSGSDRLSFKVSSDGTTWTEALGFHATTGIATGAAVTQTQTDTTAGRLMKVGDFGLGATAPNVNAGGNGSLDTAPAGFARVQDLDTEKPLSTVTGTVETHRWSASTTLQQLNISLPTSHADTIYTRSFQDGAWRPWNMQYSQRNLLGTVSLVSGIPTGAVIERGSNANGEYVRFADGTQICSHVLTAVPVNVSVNSGALFTSAGLSWTFPASFAFGTSQNRMGRLLNAASGLSVHFPYGSNTSCTGIKAYATSSITSTDLTVFAIGRWI